MPLVILGIIAVVVGLVLAIYSNRIFMNRLTSEVINNRDATIGLFALRATLYILITGLIIIVLGFTSLLFVP